MKFTRSRQRLASLTAAWAVPAALLVALPAAPAHADDVVTISGRELHEALFVAGDMSRLNENPREAVLERMLQAMYEIEPNLPVAQARAEITQMRSAMGEPAVAAKAASAAHGSVGRFEPTAIFRADYWAAELEKQAQQAARTKRARAAARKVLRESLTAQQDEKSLLAISPAQETWSGLGDYGYFSGDDVVTASFRQAAINTYYAQARDQEWAGEAGQSTTDSIAQRVNDPDLAGVSAITSQIDGDTLTISGQDALDQANVALNGADGLGLANAAALRTAAALGQAEEDIKKATTPQQELTAKQRAAQLKEEWGGHLDNAKKVVKNAETALELSVLIIGKFDPEAAKQIEEVGEVIVKTANQLIEIGTNVVNGVANVISGNWVAAAGNLIGGVMGVFGLFGEEDNAKPAPDPVKVALQDLSEQMEGFRQEMHERFDRIDHSLNTGFAAMIEGLNEILRALGDVNADLTDVKTSLVNVQSSLIRLEARLFTSFRAVEGRRLSEAINAAIGYRELNNRDMSGPEFSEWANLFHTTATHSSKDAISLAPLPSNHSAGSIARQLDENPLDMNVEFLSQYATSAGVPALAGAGTLVNPRDWALSARALELLMLQNPQYVTPVWRSRLREARTEGVRLRTALARIHTADTAAGTGSILLNSLLERYEDAWTALDTAVDAVVKPHTDAVRGGLSLWGGPRQTVADPDTITTTNSVVGTGAVSACTSSQHLPLGPGSSYADHVPAQVTTAVALEIGWVSMCAEPTFFDERAVTNVQLIGPGGRLGHVDTVTRYAKLRANVRWDYTHQVGDPKVKRLAHATRSWPEEKVCETRTRTSTGGSQDPSDWTVEVELDTCAGAGPQKTLSQKWGSTGPTFSWTTADPGDITTWVGTWLNDRQKAAYADVRAAYTRAGGSPVQSAAAELYAGKRLLQSYVEAGFPADLLIDGELRGLVSGVDDLPNDMVDVHQPWAAAAEGTTLEAVDPQQAIDQIATGRLTRLREVLRDHVRGTADEPVPPVEFRAAPLVQSTITRIELAGFVLEDEEDSTPVCVVTPAEVTAAAASLTAANAQLTAATKRLQNTKKALNTTKKKLTKLKKKAKKAKKAGQRSKVRKVTTKIRATKKKIRRITVTVRSATQQVRTARARVVDARAKVIEVRDRCS